MHWNKLSNIPAGLADGDDVGLTEAQADARYYTKTQLQGSGTAAVNWVNLTSLPAGFADGIDDGESYTAGTGLTLAANQFSVDFGTGSDQAAPGNHNHDSRYWTQTDLASAGGAPVHWGNLTSVPTGLGDGDDVGPAYTAGDGLALTGNQFRVADGGVTSAKLGPSSVIAGKVAVDAVNTFNIAPNTVTENDIATNAVWSDEIANGEVRTVDLASGAVNSDKVADGSLNTWDFSFDPATQLELDQHKNSGDHDSRYATRTELGLTGVVNNLSNPVDWTKLKSVPVGLADGDDADTTYTAGSGLSLFGNTFSASFAGNGSATTVARSDHHHDGTYWKRGGQNVAPGDFLGTTNLQPMLFRTDNVERFRIEHDGGLTVNNSTTRPGINVFGAPGQVVDFQRWTANTGAVVAGVSPTGVYGNGSGLTSLNASNLAAGTVADARLSPNVALHSSISTPGTVNNPGNPLEWTKLKNVPSGFADGVDDGSSYTAGGGLSLIGNQFSIADGGVTSARIFDSTIQLIDLAFDPATQAELNALGSPATINNPGNPVDWTKLKSVPASLADGADETNELREYCLLAAAHPRSYPNAPCGEQPSLVDPAPMTGYYSSIAIGTDGNPVISYFDLNGSLRVARCNDSACAGANETLSTVDGGSVGANTSIVIGSDGNPVISYYDVLNTNLKVARCNDPACAGLNETVSTVDSSGDVAAYTTSIAIGVDGNPIVSYDDTTNGDLKVAHCNDPACAGGNETLTAVDSIGSVGQQSSLTIGTNGNPVIAYLDQGNADLKLARCNDVGCTGANETLSAVDAAGFQGFQPSIAIGTDGNPVISYRGLKVARCNDPACAGGDETLSFVDGSVGDGQWSSIAIGANGYPIVSYYDPTNGNLKLAVCNDAACAGANERLSVLESAGDVGSYTSVAWGTDGVPVISYLDSTNSDLKVAHALAAG